MKNQGFTLIEVLVTLSLTAFLITGTAELISLSLLVKKKAETHMELVHLLTDKLERLRSLSFDHEDLCAGEYEETIETESGRFRRAWTIENLPGDRKRIETRIISLAGGRNDAGAVLLVSGKLGFRP